MEIPTFREQTCKKKVLHFRNMMARADYLTTDQRQRLLEEMQAFVDSLSTGTAVLGGAGIGLGAAILPVIGLVTGPIIGGLYGAYTSQKLSGYRREVMDMIRRLAA
jgi:hypothetical protein